MIFFGPNDGHTTENTGFIDHSPETRIVDAPRITGYYNLFTDDSGSYLARTDGLYRLTGSSFTKIGPPVIDSPKQLIYAVNHDYYRFEIEPQRLQSVYYELIESRIEFDGVSDRVYIGRIKTIGDEIYYHWSPVRATARSDRPIDFTASPRLLVGRDERWVESPRPVDDPELSDRLEFTPEFAALFNLDYADYGETLPGDCYWLEKKYRKHHLVDRFGRMIVRRAGYRLFKSHDLNS